MGALNIGPVLYGAARGMQDAERLRMEDEAHSTDQAIRAQRLQDEQQLQPLRRRALELGVQSEEQAAIRRPQRLQMEEDLGRLNLDTAGLNQRERKDAWQRLQQARERETTFNEGLRRFYASSDPQHVVDAFEQVNDVKAEFKGAKAIRNEDGSITLQVPNLPEQKFVAQKDRSGNMRSADDYFGMFALKVLNPIERLKSDLTEEYGLSKEQARTERAFGVADRRAAATREAAATRGAISGDRLSEAWYNRQHGQIKGVLDSMLKPEASPSGFAAAYAFDSDKALRGLMEQQVEQEIENGVPVRRAANNVVNDVRASYELLDKTAREHAAALAKAKVKPNDRKAVEEAAKAGNPNAVALLKVYETAAKNMGPAIAKYLEANMPAK